MGSGRRVLLTRCRTLVKAVKARVLQELEEALAAVGWAGMTATSDPPPANAKAALIRAFRVVVDLQFGQEAIVEPGLSESPGAGEEGLAAPAPGGQVRCPHAPQPPCARAHGH